MISYERDVLERQSLSEVKMGSGVKRVRKKIVSMGKTIFSSSTEAYFNHAVITARDWFM